MSIEKLEQAYKYPVLIFYWYYFKRNYKSLKEWRNELDEYSFAETNHPLNKFIKIMDKYGI